MLITVVIKWVIHQIFVCLENFISTEDTSDMSKYKREMTLNFSFYTTNQVWWQDRGFRHIRARQLYFLRNLSWENTSGYCLVKWVWKSRERKDSQEPANSWFKLGRQWRQVPGWEHDTGFKKESERPPWNRRWITLRIYWWYIIICSSEKKEN